jgi:polyisoprenoid-binding protein YceI
MKWLAGLIGGAIAAIVASLVSLPLTSPDDLIMNTATVTIAALVTGLAAGALWQALEAREGGQLWYWGILAAGFGLSVLAAIAFEQQLEGSIEFMLPLAAIIFGITAIVPPALAQVELANQAQLAGSGVALVAALGLGFGLAGMGDEPSGELELPEASNEPTPSGTTSASTDGPGDSATLTADDVAGVVYVVVPEESEMTYTVNEKLATLPTNSDAVGTTNAISGEVLLDGTTTITADGSTFESNQERRDNAIRDRVFGSDPTITFTADQLSLPTEYTPGTEYTTNLTGQVTIVGVTQPLPFEITARLDADGTLNVVGTTDFTWDVFNITPPNAAGIVEVADNVHIEVLIVARPAA